MIDFEQAMRDQDDLDALCSWSPDESTVELFSFNDSYGFARILKEYSGYPLDRPIEAIIPHGVYLNTHAMEKPERDSELPAVLNYPAFRAQVWEQETDRIVVPSASPFLYALSMFRDRFPERPDAQGTIFYPAHTIQSQRTNARWYKVADELMALDECFQPITVCMHHIDYTKGLHKPFVQRKMRVVSAGNAADPEFIYRWLHLVSSHKYAASNDLGSAVIYAAEFGLPVHLLSHIVDHLPDLSVRVMVRPKGITQAQETRKKIVELFRTNTDQPSADRAEVVRYLLGAENLKTAEGLRADLEYVASLTKKD